MSKNEGYFAYIPTWWQTGGTSPLEELPGKAVNIIEVNIGLII